MKTYPFHDRLDLTLACLLVTERHRALANRTVTPGDVARDVVDIVDHLEVDASALEDLQEFQGAVEHSLETLVAAGWISRRGYRGVVRYSAPAMAETALGWIRARLGSRPRRLRAFDKLQDEVTALVLARYGESLRS